jgi:predicted phage baseplate assembly protein
VPFFYGQAPDATVFVSRQDNQNKTHVMFGDGINGARLPTGVNNVVATYRIGSGAAMPAAGKLTVIAKSYPGLSAVLNPVAVIGGDDADQPLQIVHDAPRSVLTFGRAVSVFDYQALAEEVPSVTRARAIWGWSNPHQRTAVIVYVGDTPGAVTAAAQALAASGDPNRPVFVTAASQIAIGLTLTLLVTPGMDTTIIGNAITTALTDPETGLFGAWNIGVGQTLFDSQIEAAVLSVAGAVALTELRLTANGIHQPGELHLPGDGGFYTLAATDIDLTLEPDPNG